MASNVLPFRVNEDKRIDQIMKDMRELFEKQFGKNTFAAYVTIVSSPDLGHTEDDETEVTSYRFTLPPLERSDEDVSAFADLLYNSISKDTNIGAAVMQRYSSKLSEVLGRLIDSDNQEDEVN